MLEQPLVVDANDGTQFGLSALALSREVHRVSELETALDTELLEGRAPLVASGLQFTPTGANRFKTTDPATMYLEIYEPLLAGGNPPQVGVQLRLLDRKSGEHRVGRVPQLLSALHHPRSPGESLTTGADLRAELRNGE